MKKLKIILLDNISNLGQKGEVKEVSAGYARNFLLPKKLAEIATLAKLKQMELEKKIKEEKDKKNLKKAKKIKERLKNIVLEFKMPAQEEHLFGALGPKEIVEALKQKKIEIKEEQIIMDKHIKTTGEHQVSLDLGYNIKTKLNIKIKASNSKTSKKKSAK